jgi:hypothetical protein
MLILNPQAMLANASARNAEINFVFILKFSFWQTYVAKEGMVAQKTGSPRNFSFVGKPWFKSWTLIHADKRGFFLPISKNQRSSASRLNLG